MIVGDCGAYVSGLWACLKDRNVCIFLVNLNLHMWTPNLFNPQTPLLMDALFYKLLTASKSAGNRHTPWSEPAHCEVACNQTHRIGKIAQQGVSCILSLLCYQALPAFQAIAWGLSNGCFLVGSFKVECSSLTGESDLVPVSVDKKHDIPAEARNLVFMSSLAMNGEARGIVIRTGGHGPNSVGCLQGN
jgi:hypothetical protein